MNFIRDMIRLSNTLSLDVETCIYRIKIAGKNERQNKGQTLNLCQYRVSISFDMDEEKLSVIC